MINWKDLQRYFEYRNIPSDPNFNRKELVWNAVLICKYGRFPEVGAIEDYTLKGNLGTFDYQRMVRKALGSKYLS